MDKKIFFAMLIVGGFPFFLIGIFLVTYVFIGRPYRITGQSMAPNYVNGQYYMSQIINYKNPQRGDVVVYSLPANPDKDFIKRIIGIPDDKVLVKDGDVFVNGSKLDERSYVKNESQTFGGAFLKENQEVTVPKDHYFVLGDNRPFSADSREWGFLPKKNIIGKMSFCYYKCF